jgi:hypothetical protein
MQKLIPVNCDLYFKYVCPTCGFSFMQSMDEVTKIGKYVCVCNKLLYLKRMIKVQVTPTYTDDAKIPEVKPKSQPKKPDLPANVVSELTSALVRLGNKTKDAKTMVVTYMKDHPYNGDTDSYLIEMIQNIRSFSP